eukprot:6165777-Alexandrium_andersonii.AAC.1
MSASLVGSEMCIRDRCRTDRSLSCAFERVLAFSVAFGQVRASLEPARKPVSYTHLTLPTICSV